MNSIISQFLGYMIDFARYAQKLAGSVGLPKLNYGWLIISFFIFVIFLIGLSLGRSRILLSLPCLYIAAFLEPHFVYFSKLREIIKGEPEFWLHAGLFLVIFIISFGILNRSALKQSLTLRETSFFPIVFIAVLGIGFLASLMVAYLPSEISGDLPAGIIKCFGTKNAQFWWAVAPLIVLLFFKRKKERHLS
jgi:hypothetical protein